MTSSSVQPHVATIPAGDAGGRLSSPYLPSDFANPTGAQSAPRMRNRELLRGDESR